MTEWKIKLKFYLIEADYLRLEQLSLSPLGFLGSMLPQYMALSVSQFVEKEI